MYEQLLYRRCIGLYFWKSCSKPLKHSYVLSHCNKLNATTNICRTLLDTLSLNTLRHSQCSICCMCCTKHRGFFWWCTSDSERWTHSDIQCILHGASRMLSVAYSLTTKKCCPHNCSQLPAGIACACWAKLTGSCNSYCMHVPLSHYVSRLGTVQACW